MSTISVRFPDDVSRRLASLARKVSRSRNNLINIAVAELLVNPELFLTWDRPKAEPQAKKTNGETRYLDEHDLNWASHQPQRSGPEQIDTEKQAGLDEFNQDEA